MARSRRPLWKDPNYYELERSMSDQYRDEFKRTGNDGYLKAAESVAKPLRPMVSLGWVPQLSIAVYDDEGKSQMPTPLIGMKRVGSTTASYATLKEWLEGKNKSRKSKP